MQANARPRSSAQRAESAQLGRAARAAGGAAAARPRPPPCACLAPPALAAARRRGPHRRERRERLGWLNRGRRAVGEAEVGTAESVCLFICGYVIVLLLQSLFVAHSDLRIFAELACLYACLYVHLFVFHSVCMPVCLSVCLSVYASGYLSVCLSLLCF